MNQNDKYIHDRVVWAAAGFPYRDAGEVLSIYHSICSKCPHCNGNKCERSGNAISKKTSYLNTICIATLGCPEGKFQPKVQYDPRQIVGRESELFEAYKKEISKPRTDSGCGC